MKTSSDHLREPYRGFVSTETLRKSAILLVAPFALTSCGINPSPDVEASPEVVTTAYASKRDWTACAAEGQPVVTRYEKVCPARREGTLAVVTLPGFTPAHEVALEPTDVVGAKALGSYVTNFLNLASDGEINYTVEVVVAPETVAAEVRKRNAGECVDMKIPNASMGAVVRDLMPDIKAAHIITLGGESCEAETGRVIMGIASTTDQLTVVDVYTRQTLIFEEAGSPKSIERLAGYATHEISHNLGQGHFGTFNFEDPNVEYTLHEDPSGRIDLYELLRASTYAEYDISGNVMGSGVLSFEAGDAKLSSRVFSQVQKDYLMRSIDPENYIPKILPFQMGETTLTATLQGAESPNGLSVAVPELIPMGVYEGGYINFSLVEDEDGSTAIDISVSTLTHTTQPIAVGSVARIKLDTERPLEFAIDKDSKVTVDWDGDQALFSKLRR